MALVVADGRLAGSVTKRRRMNGMEATGELVRDDRGASEGELVSTGGGETDIFD